MDIQMGGINYVETAFAREARFLCLEGGKAFA